MREILLPVESSGCIHLVDKWLKQSGLVPRVVPRSAYSFLDLAPRIGLLIIASTRLSIVAHLQWINATRVTQKKRSYFPSQRRSSPAGPYPLYFGNITLGVDGKTCPEPPVPSSFSALPCEGYGSPQDWHLLASSLLINNCLETGAPGYFRPTP